MAVNIDVLVYEIRLLQCASDIHRIACHSATNLNLLNESRAFESADAMLKPELEKFWFIEYSDKANNFFYSTLSSLLVTFRNADVVQSFSLQKT